MHTKRRKIFLAVPVIIIAAIFLFGAVVMLLWNFIFPAVLHTEKISYWQAIALFVLCRILFSPFRRYHRDGKPGMFRGGPPWRQKWMNMTDEERAKFREEWKRRCYNPEQKKE